MEGKYSRVKLKKSNDIAKRLSIEIPIIVIPSTLMKIYIALTQLDKDCIDS